MFIENFHEYNFPEQDYKDLMLVATTVQRMGLTVKLGIKHLGGKIDPQEAALFCDPIELTLYKSGRELLSMGNTSFLDDVDRLDDIIAKLEDLGAVVLGCDTKLPDSKSRGHIGYRLSYRNSNFVLDYQPIGIAFMHLRAD